MGASEMVIVGSLVGSSVGVRLLGSIVGYSEGSTVLGYVGRTLVVVVGLEGRLVTV